MYPYTFMETEVRHRINENQAWAARQRLVKTGRRRRGFDILKAFARRGTKPQLQPAEVPQLAEVPEGRPGFTPAT
jgi:hypothetical protein